MVREQPPALRTAPDSRRRATGAGVSGGGTPRSVRRSRFLPRLARGNQVLIAQQDAAGNRIALNRSSLGLLQSVVDAAGRRYLLEYAPGNLITRINGPVGKRIRGKRIRGRYPLSWPLLHVRFPGMPRLARTVCARTPHHITQRGNRREKVFFTDDDRHAYLAWLKDYAEKYRIEILAYCLMTNHIHLIAVPTTVDGLQQALKPLHMRYAQRVNRMRGWKGHLWQGRFFSSALDEDYLWAAIRYVERNPVQARMVRKAENYAWSSASAHCGLRQDPVLTDKPVWRRQFDGIGNWSVWLAEGDEPDKLAVLRRNADKGLPCGSSNFIRKLEKLTGRALQYRPRGRPRREREE